MVVEEEGKRTIKVLLGDFSQSQHITNEDTVILPATESGLLSNATLAGNAWQAYMTY
jgi:hypothetical protein